MKLLKPSLVALALVAVVGCQEKATTAEVVKAPVLETEVQKQAYGLGASIGMYMQRNLEEQTKLGLNLDKDLIARGFMDSIENKALIEKEEIQTLLKNLDESMKKKQEVKTLADAAKNKAEGVKFLAENAKKEGVQITESGIQYVVITPAEGEKPAATDIVKVHYKGTFIDGETFDSSYERNEPASFPLNRVIKGWTEGVQLMPVGSKYKFTIPSDLAYGSNGSPPRIPANAVLEFEIELLSIKKAEDVEEAPKVGDKAHSH